MVADGESTDELRTHVQLAQTTHRDIQGAGDLGRAQLLHADVAVVRHQFDPRVVLTDQPFDVGDWHVFVQFDGQRLAVATHGADAHADAVDRDRALEAAEDLVGLGLGLPLFAALAVRQFLVDPRDQAAGQRYAEVFGRVCVAAHGFGNTTVDVEDRAGRIGQLIGNCRVGRAHLLDQFTHVLRAGTGGRLIRHGAHPLDQTGFEQAAQAHQHQADGAVAADVVLGARVQLLVDDLAVDRIENDHRVIVHPQAGGRVDPVTLPAGFAQLREHFAGVVAALAGQDHVEGFQLFNAVSVLERSNVLAHGRALATDIGSGEKHRLDKIEILLFQHPLHEHGTDHAAPTDQTYTFHRNYTFLKSGPLLCIEFRSGPERLQIPQRGDYCVTHFLRTDFSATG
ncbi:hypothetical protein EMIT0215P_60197 [Pseudomonas serboccidentalis]